VAPVLLLDNKDSFVWNLAQAVQAMGHDVEVVRSDCLTIADIHRLSPTAIIISPGPGHPDSAGVSVAAVQEFTDRVPILGVCLGHQAIGVAFGAAIRRAPPCHGKPWPITHDGTGLYAEVENPIVACRYHSLVIDPETLPADLVADAWNPEGLLMGMHHREAPTYGVQFHPESFRTPAGPTLIANFLATVPSRAWS
jgi:anthranilate synthase/aminodeoxychorismate synthase-like glutamine amidotransferase